MAAPGTAHHMKGKKGKERVDKKTLPIHGHKHGKDQLGHDHGDGNRHHTH